MTAPTPAPARQGGGNVLTQKLGPFPTYMYLLIVTIIGLGLYLYYQHKKAATPATNTTTSGQSPYVSNQQVPQFVIQNQFPPSSPSASSTSPPSHAYSTSGRDLGEYRYGGDQLSYLKQNIGSFGITQSEYQDVVNAYQKIATSQGSAAANAMHYSWIGPGNVQAIPQQSLTASQTQQNLP
jgi:hypothetical protein